MRIEKILQRAWHMVWHYRALWVFGCILALTVFSWTPALLGQRNVDVDLSSVQWNLPRDFPWQPSPADGWEYRCVDIGPFGPVCGWSLQTGEWAHLPTEVVTILTIVACVLGGLVLLFILGQIARYVAEPALIRMVDGYERTGQRSTFRQGLRMGWSRTAWRFLGIDLALDVLVWLGVGTLLTLSAVPLLPWSLGRQPFPGAGAALLTGGFSLVSFALFILVSVAFAMLKPMARRACALENLGVIASIRRGFSLARQHLKEVGAMWLVVLGANVGYAIAIVPVVILLLGVGGLLGGGLALLVHSLAVPAWTEVVAWVVGAVAGGIVFLLVLTVPLAFLGGLRETFVSSSWTLTYRAVCEQESVVPLPAPPAQEPRLGDTVTS
jgi:hypothetical protein